jgi:leucyl-tRNA synthetase
MPYSHAIDTKWQKRWQESGHFHAENGSEKPKFYCLVEFPYPSGAGLHVGHVRSYTALDVVARKKRMEGWNVLYPIGWDAFGLPTENYAIKTGRKPQEVTQENIATFRRQLQSLGLSFDWSREVNTTDPQYYKWTQWMFLEFFRAGLAYKARTTINWCPRCRIGLANEEVVGGGCERCGAPVEKREKEQWMIAITKYADRLLTDLQQVAYLPKIAKQQEDWIGKSEGAEIDFALSESEQAPHATILTVFTTRPETLFGATFLVVSPECVEGWMSQGWQAPSAVATYVQEALARTEMDRQNDTREKTGVDTGVRAVHPATGAEIPVWVADYVLGHYGTGAIMAVPAHDERDAQFASVYGLPTVQVIDEQGIMVNSGACNGLPYHQAATSMIQQVGARAKTTYKLRDWVFSRQRYWGEPIPLVHCASDCSPETGGWVPLPDAALPLMLPDVEQYQPTDNGESPLAAMASWVNTTCPTCGGSARRETDTMPNWAGSSWYFLAYIMKGVSPQLAGSITDYQEALRYWMPVDWYNGGMEHTTLHLLYSRFWNKFLCDRGHVPTSEPYAKRTSHGLILGEDGGKMSKSVGNVVNPDDLVAEYGADTLRVYELFLGPFSEPVPWNMSGMIGVKRFLEKVMRLPEVIVEQGNDAVERALQKTIKKFSEAIEQMQFNTAVSQSMVFVNTVYEQGGLTMSQARTFLTILSPFAPHVANEVWELLGANGLVEEQVWPAWDPTLVEENEVTIGVQVNGKVRGDILLSRDASPEEAQAAARSIPSVAKYLDGQEVKKFVYVPGKIVSFVV